MSALSRVLLLGAALIIAAPLGADTPKPGIEPRVDRLLRDMGSYLESASEFSFRTDVNYDRVLQNGQKILYGRRSEIAMRRPNRLHVLVDGDLLHERIWYDGKTFVILDLWERNYAEVDVPPKLDDALDFMATKYGIASPVSDVLYADPYSILVENVETGTYVGRAVIRDVPTHHLAFTQENIDWQLWIEDGPQPVPRMAVITYKNVASSPQFTVWMSDWNFAPRLADSLFQFVPPDGANEVELKPVEQ